MLHFGNVKLHGQESNGEGEVGFLGGKTPHSYANVISCMTETIEQYLWHRLCREVKAASARPLVLAPSPLCIPIGRYCMCNCCCRTESICEILLIFYDFCGHESFMLPFFPTTVLPPPPPTTRFATDIYFFVPFRIFLLSALLVFVNFLWSQGPVLGSS